MKRPANPFWDFSLAVYAEAGVADECLRLQDKGGINVNLLLFAAYMGARGVTLIEPQWREAVGLVAPWHDQIVDRLRSVRREIKSQALRDSDYGAQIEQIRTQIKAAEHDAEWVEHARLDDWCKPILSGAVRADAGPAIAANIASLLRLTALPGLSPEMPHRLMATAESRSPFV